MNSFLNTETLVPVVIMGVIGLLLAFLIMDSANWFQVINRARRREILVVAIVVLLAFIASPLYVMQNTNAEGLATQLKTSLVLSAGILLLCLPFYLVYIGIRALYHRYQLRREQADILRREKIRKDTEIVEQTSSMLALASQSTTAGNYLFPSHSPASNSAYPIDASKAAQSVPVLSRQVALAHHGNSKNQAPAAESIPESTARVSVDNNDSNAANSSEVYSSEDVYSSGDTNDGVDNQDLDTTAAFGDLAQVFGVADKPAKLVNEDNPEQTRHDEDDVATFDMDIDDFDLSIAEAIIVDSDLADFDFPDHPGGDVTAETAVASIEQAENLTTQVDDTSDTLSYSVPMADGRFASPTDAIAAIDIKISGLEMRMANLHAGNANDNPAGATSQPVESAHDNPEPAMSANSQAATTDGAAKDTLENDYKIWIATRSVLLMQQLEVQGLRKQTDSLEVQLKDEQNEAQNLAIESAKNRRIASHALNQARCAVMAQQKAKDAWKQEHKARIRVEARAGQALARAKQAMLNLSQAMEKTT